MGLVLEEQGCHINDDLGAFRRQLLNPLLGEGPDAGMGNGFEPFSCLLILKDLFAQFFSVDGLIRAQNLSAEGGDNLLPGLFTGLDDLPGKRVGVNNPCPQLLQHGCHGALARGDTAG